MQERTTANANGPYYCFFYVEQTRYALRLVSLGREDAYLWDNWRKGTEETFSLAPLD